MNHASKIRKILWGSTFFLALPQITFAAGVTNIIDAAFQLVSNVLIPLAFALCLLYFFWGVVKYIRTGAGGSEKAAEEGKKVMIWGIAGLFVAFSIWGIISFIQTELKIPPIQNVNRP
jgi:hypothetical protein